MKNFLLFFFSFQFPFLATAKKKVLQTKFITDIIIDGKMDEAIWETAPDATDFIMFQPDNGTPILEGRKLSKSLTTMMLFT
jgi:hypothetical protein